MADFTGGIMTFEIGKADGFEIPLTLGKFWENFQASFRIILGKFLGLFCDQIWGTLFI